MELTLICRTLAFSGAPRGAARALRGLSERTQEAYLRAVRQLAAFYRRPPDQLNEEELRSYSYSARCAQGAE